MSTVCQLVKLCDAARWKEGLAAVGFLRYKLKHLEKKNENN